MPTAARRRFQNEFLPITVLSWSALFALPHLRIMHATQHSSSGGIADATDRPTDRPP